MASSFGNMLKYWHCQICPIEMNMEIMDSLTKYFFIFRDHVKYHFNISHGNQSSVPAKNVTTIWYFPEFLQFEGIKNGFEGLIVEKIHRTSNIQVKVRLFICSSLNQV